MSAIHTALPGRRARLALRLLAATGVAAMLAGCYPTQPPVVQAPYPVDYRERHPITLKEGEHTVELFLGANRGGLTPPQRADVLAFAQLWRREGTSGVVIDVPHGGPTDRAAADSMREVYSILGASGVPQRAVFVRKYKPLPGVLASIKLNYSKLSATAGPCGQWPPDLGPTVDAHDYENRPYWNLGCATQRNLAAMVSNPSDLVQPRGETPAPALRRAVVMDKYGAGENPSGIYAGYETGKISDLGK